MNLRRHFATAILLLAAAPAFGQGAVLQGGPWQPGHVPQYVGQGSSQAVVLDGGGAGGGAAGVNPSEIGVTARGTGTPPYAGQGTGPFGTNICDYDAPTNSPSGYHFLCLSANAQGGGLVAYGAAGGASALPLNFNVNGVTVPFSAGGGSSFPNGIVSGGGNTQYYVSPAGSDSNTCLVGSPCLTLQHAWNTIALANYGIGGATLHLADGTYPEGVLITQSWMGAGPVSIIGNCSSPGNVVVTTPDLDGAISVEGPQIVNISCFEVRSTFSHGIYAKWGGVIEHSNMRFGTVVDGHMTTSFFGVIVALSSYAVVGSAQRHIYVHAGAVRTNENSIVVTFVGSPAINTFAFVVDHGTFFFYSMSFAGSPAAGTQKYLAVSGGHIEGNTSCNGFPGSVAGLLLDSSYCIGSEILMPLNQVNGIANATTLGTGTLNNTPSTSIAPVQWSPAAQWSGTAYNTSTLASWPLDWRCENQTVSAAVPIGRLVCSYQSNGGGYGNVFSVNPAGAFNVIGGYFVNGAAMRLPLAAATNFFVATTGSDSNTCLSGSPCLTVQRAYDVIAGSYDQMGQPAVINVADGTYSSPVVLSGPPVKTGTLSIVGNTGTPANVIFTTTSASAISCTNANVTLSGFELRTTGGFAEVLAGPGCDVYLSNLRFGAALLGDHINAFDGGRVHITGSYSITGGAGYHWHARVGGRIETGLGVAATITLSGTPAFSNNFAGVNFGQIYLYPSTVTFSGSATGPRFLVHNLGRLESGGLGISGLPGNAIGLLQSGGEYDDLFAVGIVGTFSLLPACSTTLEGAMAPVNDSSTVTWGATITGGSTNHVGAYCDGTNWTVFSK